jgi:hypothetical protein
MKYDINPNRYDSSVHELCVFVKLNNLYYRHNIRLHTIGMILIELIRMLGH